MTIDLKEWSGKKVAVIGLGISNLALISVLQEAGAILSARDRKSMQELGPLVSQLQALNVELVLGGDYLKNLTDFDTIVVSPGVPKHLPELSACAPKLSSEMAFVFHYAPVAIYGITGSSGKTTTTSLVGAMLEASGISIYVGGNIGNPVISELKHMSRDQKLILELSSFQLEDLTQSPRGALVTNIAENHLDFHLTMDSYVAAKENIYRYQNADDFLVLNYDDPATRAMAQEAPGQVYYFSLQGPVPRGCYLAGDEFVYRDDEQEVVFGNRQEFTLPGVHNVANFLAASVFSYLIGANWEAIRQVSQTFKGVPHRLEFVRTVAGVSYYNDSIATTPDRTRAALHSFEQPVILLAGGSDKHLSYKQLGEDIYKNAKQLILFGATAPQIRDAVLANGPFPIIEVLDLQKAIKQAQLAATQGDVVLLSPACASFDQYSDFVARGDHFRRLVQDLEKTI